MFTQHYHPVTGQFIGVRLTQEVAGFPVGQFQRILPGNRLWDAFEEWDAEQPTPMDRSDGPVPPPDPTIAVEASLKVKGLNFLTELEDDTAWGALTSAQKVDKLRNATTKILRLVLRKLDKD